MSEDNIIFDDTSKYIKYSRNYFSGNGSLKPMPEKHITIPVYYKFTKKKLKRLEYGGIDERWFTFLEDNKLYVYRCSGFCIYILEIHKDGNNILTMNTQDYAQKQDPEVMKKDCFQVIHNTIYSYDFGDMGDFYLPEYPKPYMRHKLIRRYQKRLEEKHKNKVEEENKSVKLKFNLKNG